MKIANPMMASATSIQFWIGMPPKIANCLTGQSSTKPHPKSYVGGRTLSQPTVSEAKENDACADGV